MKKYVLIVLIFPFTLYAQELPVSKEGRITFTGEISVPGFSQKVIQETALKIIAGNFNTLPENKILENPWSLVFKGYSFYHINKIGVELPYFFYFTLHIFSEDGRCKYISTEFIDDQNIPLEKVLLQAKDSSQTKQTYPPATNDQVGAIIEGLKGIGESFKARMTASLSPNKSR